MIAGCSHVGSEPPASEPGGLLETSQACYDARLLTAGHERVAVDIPYVTRNTTADILVLIGCVTPPLPTLEKRVEGEWVAAYSPITQACLSPPWKIAPGEVRQDTLHVSAALPGQNFAPVFEADEIEGTYRLKRAICARVGEDRAGAGLLPLKQRVSNTFELE